MKKSLFVLSLTILLMIVGAKEEKEKNEILEFIKFIGDEVNKAKAEAEKHVNNTENEELKEIYRTRGTSSFKQNAFVKKHIGIKATAIDRMLNVIKKNIEIPNEKVVNEFIAKLEGIKNTNSVINEKVFFGEPGNSETIFVTLIGKKRDDGKYDIIYSVTSTKLELSDTIAYQGSVSGDVSFEKVLVKPDGWKDEDVKAVLSLCEGYGLKQLAAL